jgi:hypothetical protein
VFLNKELLVCNTDVDYTYSVTENIQNAYYCVPITDDGQLDDLASWMGTVENHMGHNDPLIVDPYKELRDVSKKKTDNADLSD